jgi:REP element-mobilizing transposase RayT
VDGEMESNEIGQIAERFWQRIPERYKNIILDAFVVMPNHIHGIIGIKYDMESEFVGAIHELSLQHENPEEYRKSRRQMYLSKIIGWYKMNVAKKSNVILDNTGNKFWQQNYYEHIIRNEKSLNRIRDYILNNPVSWEEDQNHPDNME